MRLAPLWLGVSGAILAALGMVLVGILGLAGLRPGLVGHMEDVHAFFSLSAGGIILGALEAAAVAFAGLFLLGWLYNLFIGKAGRGA